MKRVQINELDFKGQNIYIGIDVHLKSWSVTVLSEHSVLKKFSQNPDAAALHRFSSNCHHVLEFSIERLTKQAHIYARYSNSHGKEGPQSIIETIIIG
jgi:DNA relaxase NicK